MTKFKVLLSVLLFLPSLTLAASPPVEILKPIRQTTAKIMIQKFSVGKDAAGEFQYQSELVCQKEVPINVYDGRGKSSFGTSNQSVLDCDAKSIGGPIRLSANASVILRDQQIFNGETASEIRANTFSLTKTDVATGASSFLSSAQGLSRDLAAPQLLTADQGLNWDCSSGKCAPVTTEMFMTTIEFGP